MSETKNNILIQWHVEEYYNHQRSKRWYTLALIALGLLILYAVLTGNFLFAIILIIAGITMSLRDKEETKVLEVAITEDGITIGQQHYGYALFKNFWMYYEPDEQAKSLFLEFKSSLRPRLGIPLVDTNPLRVRTLLLDNLPENLEQEQEPLGEQLTRYFKL